FQKMTLGKIVIMGRKTYESLVVRPLPGRTTYILTRDAAYSVDHPDVKVFTDLEKCLFSAHLASEDKEIMIAGGGEIYRAFLPYADRVYATIVNGDYDGDATFPELPEDEWEVIGEHSYASELLELFYVRLTYKRIKKVAELPSL